MKVQVEITLEINPGAYFANWPKAAQIQAVQADMERLLPRFLDVFASANGAKLTDTKIKVER